MLKPKNENTQLTRRSFIIWALASAITLQSNTVLAQDILRVDEKTAKDILHDLLLIIDPSTQASKADRLANFEYNDQWQWIYNQNFRNFPNLRTSIAKHLEFLRNKGGFRYFSENGNENDIYKLLVGDKKLILNTTRITAQEDRIDIDEENLKASLEQQIQTFAKTRQGPLYSTSSDGRKHTYTGRPKDVPSAYNQNHFYWTWVGKNIPGTYLNARLCQFALRWDIPTQISSRGNILIRTSEIDGLNYTAVYDTNGELKVLTYVSIGTDEDPTNLRRVIKNSSERDLIQMNKLSIQWGGSSMWWAIHVSGGIFFHSSALWINGRPRSHGCIRTPLLYLDAMHKIIRENPSTSILMEFDSLY